MQEQFERQTDINLIIRNEEIPTVKYEFNDKLIELRQLTDSNYISINQAINKHVNELTIQDIALQRKLLGIDEKILN